MPEGDEDFGFVPDDADIGFVPDDAPAEPEGMAEMPEGYREQGRRELVLPETTFEVDAARPSRSRTTTSGEAYEVREIQKDPEYLRRRDRVGQQVAPDWRQPDPTDFSVGGILGTRPSIGGFELPSQESVGRFAQTGSINALFPTAERPEGMSASAPDLRSQAGARAATSLFGWADELGELGGYDAEQMRRTRAQSAEQAPGSAAAGGIAESIPLMAIPGAQGTALSRMATAGGIGLGTGMLRGAGESDAERLVGGLTDDSVARDALMGGAVEGLAGAGTAGLAEGAAPLVRRLAEAVRRRGDSAARGAVQSRLEASGVWGNRAMRAADEMPGGPEALAQDMRRLGIGHGVGDPARIAEARATGAPVSRARLPRSTRTPDDAAQVMDEAGERMQSVLDRMDEAARQPASPLAQLDPAPSRSLATHRQAFAGLSPEEATAVATGQRPPVAGARQWEPIHVVDETAFRAAQGGGGTYREAADEASGLILQDGNHRLAAAREAGATSILARIQRYGPDGEVLVDEVRPIAIDAVQDATQRGLVQMGRVADEMEAIARRYESLPVGGQELAQAIRTRIIEPLRARPQMTFGEAHQQRRLLDDLIRSWRANPDLTTASGQLQTARRAIARAMEDAAEGLDPALRDAWRSANRDYSVGAFAGEHGQGASRLSVGGGMGGAIGTGVELAMGGTPLTSLPMSIANRELAQQQRMWWPGARAGALEALAPRLRSLGARGQAWAQTLEGAGRRGRTALAAAHVMLQTDPNYRAAVAEMEAAESGEESTDGY